MLFQTRTGAVSLSISARSDAEIRTENLGPRPFEIGEKRAAVIDDGDDEIG